MFSYGVDYYPEQWPQERWNEDARLMAEAGFNVVRLAEFAWSRLEPEEGCFRFDWLDRAIDLLAKRGMRIVLGTPTASAPPWVMESAPGLYRVREDGRTVTYGNRRAYCPSHPAYRTHACRIVRALAEHYRHHPAVIGWQIDNEFGERCYCASCQDCFRIWLQERYGSLDRMNEAWGTAFWSHTYTCWDQIPLPVLTGGSPNPGLALDFARFSSDAYVAFQASQAAILRETCPHHFLTHNFMGFGFEQLNAFDLARDLDLVAWDNYPRSQWNGSLAASVDPFSQALDHAAMRGLKGENFWVMEQQVGPAGWERIGPAPQPGELRLWAYQSIAHGADGILFFRWRTARFGTEQFWHGLLDHSGALSRRYHEIARMGKEIGRLGSILQGAEVWSRIAMLHSYDSRFAFQLQSTNPGFSYAEHFKKVYEALAITGLGVDVVSPEADLSGYRLVVAPALYVLDQPVVENLVRYVLSGGQLLLTPRCGVKDETNAVFEAPPPGPLAELAGAFVEDYESLPLESRNEVKFEKPEMGSYEIAVWCDVLSPSSARTIARYQSGWLAGKSAVTEHDFGGGRVVYAGALGGVDFYATLARYVLPAESLVFTNEPLPGLEVAIREKEGRRLVFLLNHTLQPQPVTLDPGFEVLLGQPVDIEAQRIPPLEVWILREK
jgi:beta-galactosidase